MGVIAGYFLAKGTLCFLATQGHSLSYHAWVARILQEANFNLDCRTAKSKGIYVKVRPAGDTPSQAQVETKLNKAPEQAQRIVES